MATAALTGTIVSGGVTEPQIVAGGETLIITLTDDTWVATVGDDNNITIALQDGITSAGSETFGWNGEVRDNMLYEQVSRDSATVITITFQAESDYQIDNDETITVTIPATALAGSTEIIATPTFPVSAVNAVLTGTIVSGGVHEGEIIAGGETLIITLTGDTWVATVGADNAITTALIAGIDSDGSETLGWDNVVKAGMAHGDVTRDSNVKVTIVLGAEATYQITDIETITVTIPATALTGIPAIVATPTFPISSHITVKNPHNLAGPGQLLRTG